MGTGDYISVTMSGGSPWGFRLDGGLEQNLPLKVSQIRNPSKAESAGLRVGDEVVSINGNPCAGLPYSRVVTFISGSTDILRMLIKRSPSGIHETLTPEAEDRKVEDVKAQEFTESTTLQIRSAQQTSDPDRDTYPSQHMGRSEEAEMVCELRSTTQESEVKHFHKITPKVIETRKEFSIDELPLDGEESGIRQGTVVELQLNLSHGRLNKSPSVPVVTLLGTDRPNPSETGPNASPNQTDTGTTLYHSQPEDSGHHVTKTFRLDGVRESTSTQGVEAEGPPLTEVEVIFACTDREKEASQAPADRGCAGSQEEGGQPEAPPSGLSLGISSDGTEQEEEDEHSEKDHSRPHKHRARHARLRRSESLSEKKVKEAKSKCKTIALLLTQAPTPSSKGVLMFKKRRQRAKKYTLVSYGTGELEPEEPDEEDNEGEEGDPGNTYEITLLGTSESELDEDFFSDPEKKTHIVTFDWDTGLLEFEKSKEEASMESLPETKGKGALMFARRKQRMDQITAEQEEMKNLMQDSGEADMAESVKHVVSHQAQHCESTRTQSCVSKSYIEVSQSHARVQNGFSGTQEASSSFQSSEAHRLSSSNRSAKPFSGVQNRAALPFSPTRNVTSPFSDLPTPPTYSSISPLPEPLYKVSSPVAGIAQPNVWSPYESMEQIASRDERISVPAKKTGILQDAKKRSTAKPMFTFKEPPKVNPNPALLSLVQTRKGRRGPGAGVESGPEEDYLSLGAEACNFMQAGKQKNPPPVAPKPATKSSPAPTTPVSPVWSPPAAASTAAPSFQSTHISQAMTTVPVNVARPALHSYQPPVSHEVAYKGPQSAEIVNQTNTPKTPPTTPLGNMALAGGMGPSFEMPALQGKGAALFAKRQSRMEKFVVDSDTVQANMARSSSPTPSLPPSWKYSSNVRAPPPLAYNPTQSPLYPLAASKSQPHSANTAAKNIKKKPKKALNALDVMKHQPYQLNASLFTFQPPSDGKIDLVQKQPAKFDSGPPLKQALPTRAVNHAPSSNFQAASPYSQPAYNQQPSYQSNASIPAFESAAPHGYPMFTKQESTATPLIPPPRPKFSARKVGASAQERDGGRSLSLPGRRSAPADLQRVASPTSPLAFQPTSSYSSKPAVPADATGRQLTPWEAAAKSPYGLVDDAFTSLSMQESIAANVVSAARRKTLPEPPLAWKQRVSYGVPDRSMGLYGRNQLGVTSPTKSIVSAPGSTLNYGSNLKYPFSSRRSITDPNMVSLDTQSEYCMPSAPDSYFNSYARAWRR
ncbi:synaptopodin-2 isoform X2 [Ambystoma mexicanum]|uniref:synaptopodin-2 isoform X2 n=1 Tax=Ambystoma mexicanum TaxID=8296 RepID=UPI0037E7F4DB